MKRVINNKTKKKQIISLLVLVLKSYKGRKLVHCLLQTFPKYQNNISWWLGLNRSRSIFEIEPSAKYLILQNLIDKKYKVSEALICSQKSLSSSRHSLFYRSPPFLNFGLKVVHPQQKKESGLILILWFGAFPVIFPKYIFGLSA